MILSNFAPELDTLDIFLMPKDKKIYILYLCVCIALLPVLMLRDFTPDNELRYLSIADEALRDHTFFTFTNHGVPYADKPPCISGS